ncbi:hypothetical protein [Microbacterium pumilum]|uniref:Sortase n=1 Tax=Microbacterium pumilum TaxID=344165 RepID=A0ABP5DUN5_9MICO
MARSVIVAIIFATGLVLGVGGTIVSHSTAIVPSVESPVPRPPGTPEGAREPDAVAVALAPPPIQRRPQAETTFVPISPCRIADTRVAGGAIAANATRAFYVQGTSGFLPQGGTVGGCDIPAGATAVALSAAVTDAGAAGNMTAYPTGGSSGSGFINVTPGQVTRASGTFAIAPSGKSLTVRNRSGAPAGIVLDVQGYYVPPLEAMIDPAGTPYSGSSRVLGATQVSTGVYDVRFDRQVVYCSVVASTYFSQFTVSTDTYLWADDRVRVKITTATGAPVNEYFYIIVSC